MSIIRHLDHARERMTAYMVDAGGRCTISRKQGGAWTTIAADVPVIVESARANSARIDPQTATSNDANVREVTMPHTTDLAPGDRITVTAPRGTGLAPDLVLTIGSVSALSMAPCAHATAVIEQNAVETYAVTIERWDAAADQYLAILTADTSVITSTTTIRADQRGASGTTVLGTLIFDPVPSVPVHPQDSVVGIPWATGAFITRVHPVVGSRLEVAFSYTLGDTT